MLQRKVLLTGGSGFVGQALIKRLDNPILIGRSKPSGFQGQFYRKDISGGEDFGNCLIGVDVIIHCAGLADLSEGSPSDQLQEYRRVNTEGTLGLAQQAEKVGVKRFIFISSIKVNGEATGSGLAYTSNDKPKPSDSYGLSKAEAEAGLQELSTRSKMEVVILRPPLVYGPGVKGNFLSLMKIADTSVPLPLGSVRNLRSMVYVENLVDLVLTCIDHPKAVNKVFLVSDGHDVSVSELLMMIRRYMNRPAMLMPIPVFFLSLVGKLMGRSDLVTRLFGNLQVDHQLTVAQLGWVAPYTVEEGVNQTVKGYLKAMRGIK